MSVETFTRISWIFSYIGILFSASFAQEIRPVTFPTTQENRTVRNEQLNPLISSIKRYDWSPPTTQTIEQEVTQIPAYQISPWMKQSPMPASYYLRVPPTASSMGQVRSDHYGYHSPEYAEYNHPVVHHEAGTSLGLGPKHLAIVSFIGLLLLFAVIQSSLMSSKRKDALVEALSTRKRRDLFLTEGLRAMTPEQEEILNDDARLRCIQRTICMENRKLIENFGTDGKKLAKYLTKSVQKSLRKSSGWDRLIEDAGAAGLRRENCNVLYRDCVLPVISRFHRKDEK